jgi:hypothetical protein
MSTEDEKREKMRVMREANRKYEKQQEEREKKEKAGWEPEKRKGTNPAMGIPFNP